MLLLATGKPGGRRAAVTDALTEAAFAAAGLSSSLPGAVQVAGPQRAGDSTSAASRAAHSRVRRSRHQKYTSTTTKKSTGSSSVHK
jgi:hypothetical protein